MKPSPHDILGSVFGYETFRPMQEQIVQHVVDGGDALVIMPTGGGKSLCYQIPALARDGVAVIVSPLIALMQDQVRAMRELGVRAACLNSSLELDEVRLVERQMRQGQLDLIYIAPERLVSPRFMELLRQCPLALFAIDEAHCVSQWGHDFRPEYRQLRVLHEQFPGVPRIALTATADAPTRRDIVEQLDLGEAKQFIGGFDRPNIRYRVVPKQNALEQLLRFIEAEHGGESGIVYCMSRKKVERVAQWLAEHGHPALPYHAGLDASVRAHHQERFLREERMIVVATIAFGMGIDKPDVRFVAHLDLPKSIEAYYQETGRAGRDGLPAQAWMTYGLGDAVTVRGFIDRSEAGEQQKRIEHAKLNALLGFCESVRCRRHVLLDYFGDATGADSPRDGAGLSPTRVSGGGGCKKTCNNCDICIEGVETWDGTTAAQKALSCIWRTDQTFGAAYVISVLLGDEDERIRRFGHDRLSTFGIGKELDRRQWTSVLRQLVALGVLNVDPQHGSLRLTEAAKAVLKGEQPVLLRKDPKKPARRDKAAAKERRSSVMAELDDAARRLFEALRQRRLELSRQQDVPPYVIFHDATLMEMARRRPTSLAAMSSISGVGRAKLDRYGEAFVEVVRGGDA